jgi:hypothetical protein
MVSFTSLPLHPRENNPDINLVEGWVGARAGLNAVEMDKILYH